MRVHLDVYKQVGPATSLLSTWGLTHCTEVGPATFFIVEWPLSKKCIIKGVTMKVKGDPTGAAKSLNNHFEKMALVTYWV